MKGIALISGIIFLAIIIIAITMVYNLSIPITQKMHTATNIEKMKTVFLDLDDTIRTVSLEGNGSRRTKAIRIDEGKVIVDSENNLIYYKTDTDAKIISPRTMQTIGNLIFGSNLETSTKEGEYSTIPAFVLENEHLIVYVKKIGSEGSPVNYNTNDLLLAVFQKDLNEYLPLQSLEISVDSNPISKTGRGYTTLDREGNALPYGKAIAFMSSDYLNYSIEFILESGADFIEIKGKEI
ncbi:MAG: hypothetical protein ISS36_01885 [Candidatus Aenigmarchaeota archaeon]|nr:hypothetical protein [Candidatus Aenigmarchaeota archaeon]